MNVNGTSIQGVSRAQKRERTFEFSLPVLVQGSDAADRKFSERTVLSSLSAKEAVFMLRARVMIGIRLNLNLQIPQTSMLEKPLELCVSGTVQYVRSDTSFKNKSQLVSMKLDSDFQIQSLAS
jgi:hypothetical protein